MSRTPLCSRRETRSTSRRARSTACRATRARSSRRACSRSSSSARARPRPSTRTNDGARRRDARRTAARGGRSRPARGRRGRQATTRSGEALVRVHAAAITRDELGWPVDRLPAIPSYEISGVVVGTGDEVYALTPFDRDGVAAEYAVVPADVLAPKPLRLSHVEA